MLPPAPRASDTIRPSVPRSSHLRIILLALRVGASLPGSERTYHTNTDEKLALIMIWGLRVGVSLPLPGTIHNVFRIIRTYVSLYL